ncbi:addiction module antidote protein, HigA family [Corynebacterium glutamicum ATCC 14067]|nr:addiction module antidote protein, HigA family [Corynebacterium glutamicum ATCC 14067]QDQ20946.1 HigA family addiction module antidote protein [Corynebacterium glutamicum]QDQ24516.1 HigA family addiction module antidote protein [Corynebacterium glutamicum]
MFVVAPQPRKPQHPGEILSERFLEPRGISHYDLAKTLHITEATITNFVEGRTDLTIGLAVRLSRSFDLSTQEWIALQRTFDQAHRRSA